MFGKLLDKEARATGASPSEGIDRRQAVSALLRSPQMAGLAGQPARIRVAPGLEPRQETFQEVLSELEGAGPERLTMEDLMTLLGMGNPSEAAVMAKMTKPAKKKKATAVRGGTVAVVLTCVPQNALPSAASPRFERAARFLRCATSLERRIL